ncbi:cupin domain-containing protein [Pseudidiomarina sp. CB1]|uniref:cupin domain-containing protein n=1 Tax=Pseudidiomarina sp. CB1 TaxID=2972484 RepID=UPI0021620C44|nr:cupin domain-containing protein [Pseudidiomarina sp. CB1]
MLNMDFSQRVVIETARAEWQPSPAAGIERKLLEREEAERGRATSIVRYAPRSRFATHQHPLGEEIFVLEGVFSDDTGDYPAGTYLRNPPGSSHAPFSEHVALVKWPAGELFKPHRHYAGEEIVVLSGEFIDEHGRYPQGTWLRNPHGSKHTPRVEEETIIYVKTGHLPIPELAY